MPKVGKKRFPYNSKGIAAAQAEAKRTGEDMETGEGVNVSRDAEISKKDKEEEDKKSKKGDKKAPDKKGGKKPNPFAKKGNPFAKKGGY